MNSSLFIDQTTYNIIPRLRDTENILFGRSNFTVAKPLVYRLESISNPSGLCNTKTYSAATHELQGSEIILKI